jgi:hypothetical protein
MIPYELRDTVKDLYTAFSNQPYVPSTSWTTTKEFTLDSLYQHTTKQYEHDPLFVKQHHEFVLDTTLVHPVGSAPTSRDFQSHAFTRLA